MASVYKTLSSSGNVEKAPTGEKKIKQRVLMLVREAHAEKNECMLTALCRVREEPHTAIAIYCRTSIL
jgi:hypothetical protein